MNCRFKTLLDTIENEFKKTLVDKRGCLIFYNRKKTDFIEEIMNLYREVRNRECKLVCEKG